MSAAPALASGADEQNQHRLQLLVNTLEEKLAIPQFVTVVIAANDPLMMSVEASVGPSTGFRLTVDPAFLDTLTPGELEAAIAHELGHVWVFTHHPYLQTEQLANEIAMRVVSRESLERVYEKVWKRAGTKGDLVRFLGPATEPQPVVGLATVDQSAALTSN